jgi:hypothetical protein
MISNDAHIKVKIMMKDDLPGEILKEASMEIKNMST